MKKGHNIRIATIDDLKEIIQIYNYAVKSTFETADTVSLNWKNKKTWFKKHPPESYPLFVYEIKGQIKGWISISPYREGRKALKFTIEISYYVHPENKQMGIGSYLLEHAIKKCKKLKYKTLLAIVLDKNEKSINLLKKYQFSEWGHMPNVAEFDGIECGHVYYGLRILN